MLTATTDQTGHTLILLVLSCHGSYVIGLGFIFWDLHLIINTMHEKCITV